MTSPILVWFRQDLRLEDQPALHYAKQQNRPVIPIFIHGPGQDPRTAGRASQWWLHHSLKSLQKDLKEIGSRLILRQGDSSLHLKEILTKTKADTIVWNARYEPYWQKTDRKLRKTFEANGITIQIFNGSLLFDPSHIQTKSGTPYKVFTPFWKACLKNDDPGKLLPECTNLKAPQKCPKSQKLNELNLLPKKNWAQSFSKEWRPGTEGAHESLDDFLEGAVNHYKEDRNIPDRKGTSKMSPHLHYGEISPRQIWYRVQDLIHQNSKNISIKDAECFLSEVGWREFSYHLLYHFPHLVKEPLNEKFKNFPWKKNQKSFKNWTKGLTGYPIVDAGMRELWHTGWMHNRVRMIVASFLVKGLLIHWKDGAKWFWDTLVDADLASNTMSWQWVAGCGADASPYFRIFNPVLQGEKFDPYGDYVKKWVPELKSLPKKWIHKPHLCPNEILTEHKVTLGKTYPKPLIDHKESRELALSIYKAL